MKKTIPLTVKLILILVLSSNNLSSFAQNIDFGKSLINVTKGLNGGTFETGDTLEIRASFVVRAGTYDSCRYQDLVPAGTLYIPGTIRVLTNEGKIYKQFTDLPADDAGWLSASTITINLGFNPANAPANAFRRGRVSNTDKPSFYGSTCIMVASFRVRITALSGNLISTGGGIITYKSGSNPIQTFTFPSNTIIVYTNYGICTNTIGTNAIGTEFNGSFGSGKPRNRAASANVPAGYTYQLFSTNNPNDYNYGIVNNTSTQNYTTLNTWPKPDPASPSHRVFSVWDIIGDHTGAANPLTGNPAADTVANPNAGYMLVINAAYRIDSAFQQTITGLCPNTYYEISCWMRNICSKCGCDSNGKGATNSAGPPYYIPTAAGDSSGVYPNLTFDVNGVDYFTTGNILYTGNWVKKGFTFLTGPSQTSFILKFFNNASGGGGNDWALDDISVSTCSPNMKYSPSLNPVVCDSNTLTIYDTVRCFFNNYVYYKWQRSTNGGSTWTDVTGALGPITPVWNGSSWEYVTSYTIPPGQTLPSNNGDKYRLVVATTIANLSNAGCQFTDAMNIITIQVQVCGLPMHTKLLTFQGQKQGQQAFLNWEISNESESVQFDIEKSLNGADFNVIATSESNIDQVNYTFTDPMPEGSTAFYRLRMYNGVNKAVYSKIIQLNASPIHNNLINVINPFTSNLDITVSLNAPGMARIELMDQNGTTLIRNDQRMGPGVNRIILPVPQSLGYGLFILRINSEGNLYYRKLWRTHDR